MIFGFLTLRLYSSPLSLGTFGTDQTHGTGRFDGQCDLRRLQHPGHILQYWLDAVLLLVFQIEIYPQSPVGIGRVRLNLRDHYVFRNPDIS